MSNFLQSQGLQSTKLLCPWDLPGKNNGVRCHFLLQGIFLSQRLNLGLLHCRQMLYHLSHQGAKVAQSCLTLCNSMDCSLWNSPGQNTGMGSLSFLQGIFPTQRSNSGLVHYRWILYQLSHKGSPRILEWVAYPFSSRSSRPRSQTGVSCIAGRFNSKKQCRCIAFDLTSWATREAF